MSRPGPDVASKEKNEYIPTFITKKPFWVPEDESGSGTDYLEHQRRAQEAETQNSNSQWYERGKRKGPAATKYRKGACENCGAMTHKTKECLSRPRAKGAKWTGKNIAADEVVQEVKLGYDAKRDRWNGYDAAEYLSVVKDYEELEAMKKEARGDAGGEADAENGGTAATDAARYAEESDMGRTQSTATRNLRLREDTAKYLLNLDLDSATYDPKSRAMVDAGASTDQAAALVAEENFARASGDAAEFEKAQRFAWESQERGDANRVHLQAGPTSGEFVRKKQLEEATKKREAQQKHLAEMYGGAATAMKKNPLKDAVVENERFVEYDASGNVKALPETATKSKYAEDVFINNHTSVWGSWWKDFQWGYQCCHSTVKNSYCTGEQGRAAFEESSKMGLEGEGAKEEEEDYDEAAVGRAEDDKEHKKNPSTAASRKRTVHERQSGITEEELEAYKRSRTQADDPMSHFAGAGGHELVQ